MSEKERMWMEIVRRINECRACPLYKYRTKAVPGEGSLNATILFLGEAPGRKEDESGRPFVGAAGQLLTKLLAGVGLSRSEVFITNVVKCRPPNNRDPKEEEVLACSTHTNAILTLIRPKVIVTLGNHAGKYIFEILGGRRWLGISRIRGRIYEVNLKIGLRVYVIPTYHPAAALYNPQLRNTLEEDFSLIREALNKLRSEDKKKYTLLDFIKR